MPTYEELFGKSASSGPRVLNLKNEGENVAGVVTAIDQEEPMYEMVRQPDGGWRPGLQKFWLDGKPVGVPAEKAAQAGLNPVTQIMLTLTGVSGQWKGMPEPGSEIPDVRTSVTGSQREREAFKAAVAEAGSIEIGDTFGKRLSKRDGNQKLYEMRVIKAG